MKKATQKIWNILVSKSKPISLIHFITNRCNARCAHCFIDFDNKEDQKSSMPVEIIDQLTKTMGDQLMNVNLTGGEPFLNRDISDIARCYFKNTSIDSLFISTHGGFTDRIVDFATKMKKEFPTKKLIFSISIDHFPDKHNQYRRIKNLFQNALTTYHKLNCLNLGIFTNIGITLSPFNYNIALALYSHLKAQGVRSVTVTLVRDEGVYKTPMNIKNKLITSYASITHTISKDIKNKTIEGFNTKDFLGRMMNEKEEIINKNIIASYIDNKFISPCRSGALLGVLYPNGDVYPCEILQNKTMGNVYDYNLNFLDLWNSNRAKNIRNWIVDSKCRCTYECAWSYNVLGNGRYLPKLAKAFLSQ